MWVTVVTVTIDCVLGKREKSRREKASKQTNFEIVNREREGVRFKDFVMVGRVGLGIIDSRYAGLYTVNINLIFSYRGV